MTMPRKTAEIQDVARRAPKQERALHKIALIFEATMRLLDSVEICDLTINAIAAMVSAVFETYGGRRRVHKDLLEHALTQRRA